jgi:methylase of polypeptide subunit release factors
VEYARKIGIIQNSLYGVDIQPIAAEISKLRCFLTLIVDENIDDTKKNRGIEPLPNLEFKFVTADTLIKLPEQQAQTGLFDNFEEMELLKELREEYLQSSGKKKIKIKERFIKVQSKMFKNEMHLFSDTQSRAYKLSSWNPFSHDKAEWFDPKWMYGVDDFDVVIGNPPYVQMQKDKGVLANRYKNEEYATYERTGDVYSLFYERGFQLLSGKSILCYITSNQWIRAKYGESLRGHFLEKNPLILVNLGPGVFQSATVDTNILIAENFAYEDNFSAINIIKGSQINHLTKSDMQLMSNLDKGRWSIDTKEEAYISQKIFEKGKLLKNWNITINRGVLTGFNEAFIITQDKRDELVEQDPNSSEIIKPILKGRDIEKYQTEWNESFIISTFPALNINIEKYPVVKNYLESFQPKLNQTGGEYINESGEPKKTRKKTANKWFETQDQIGYYKEFPKEKIIWKRIGSSLRFSFSNAEIFSLDSTCLATGEKIKYLTAYLNSKLAQYQLFKSAPKTGMGDLIISVQALNPLLVYYPNEQQENQFNKLVDYIIFLLNEKEQINPHVPNSHLVQLFEEVIDAMVMELYFEEDFKNVDIAFIIYAERDFKPIDHLKTEIEVIEVIHQAYQVLRKKDNEIRNNLKLMDVKLADIVMPIKTAK